MAGKAAWTFSKPRGQYYYHQYEDDKPDLNLRDSQVRTLIEVSYYKTCTTNSSREFILSSNASRSIQVYMANCHFLQKFMIFWTNAGVDGFYIRSVPRLYENEELTASDYICNCDKVILYNNV